MIILIILLCILGYAIFYVISNKIHIQWDTFFKKGFKKLDNTFGLYCYVGKQGKGKTYSAIKFLIIHKKLNSTICFAFSLFTNITIQTKSII